MGPTRTGRLHQLALSRKLTWPNPSKVKTDQHTPTGSSSSDDKTSKTTSDRSDVAGHYDRGMEKT